jgi:hypothetical protein
MKRVLAAPRAAVRAAAEAGSIVIATVVAAGVAEIREAGGGSPPKITATVRASPVNLAGSVSLHKRPTLRPDCILHPFLVILSEAKNPFDIT